MHIISWVTLLGVAISCASLVLVLSVFNGFENLILSMYNSFDPHLVISASKGKTFELDALDTKILNNKNIQSTAFVLEEKALIKYRDKQFLANIKGVSNTFENVVSFDSLIIEGDYFTKYETNNVGVVGAGVSYHLSLGLGSVFDPVHVYLPNRNSKNLLNTSKAFKHSTLIPTGIFSVQADIDEKFIITPIEFVQQLSEKEGQISSVEIKLGDLNDIEKVQFELANSLTSDFIVKNRYENQLFLYKILNTEKLAVFLVLLFILIIATFNAIGSLTMMILDKKEKILAFKSLGANMKKIKLIFFYTSMMVILLGAIIGIFLGLFVGFLQQKFGFISLEGMFVIESYPVEFYMSDIIIIILSVIVIGAIASWIPCNILINNFFKNQNRKNFFEFH